MAPFFTNVAMNCDHFLLYKREREKGRKKEMKNRLKKKERLKMTKICQYKIK
jgi:hypothetical protein